MRTRPEKAFSLVEMIVAMVITTTIAAAIYATFTQGLRLWSRGSKDRGQWKVDLFLERATGQIRNTVNDPLWGMNGTRTVLAFATVTSEKAVAQPVYLRYAFDGARQILTARRIGRDELYDKKLSGRPAATILDKVEDFEIEYYAFDGRAKKYRWFPKWDQNCLPETIKISIRLANDKNERAIRLIDVPAGNACGE